MRMTWSCSLCLAAESRGVIPETVCQRDDFAVDDETRYDSKCDGTIDLSRVSRAGILIVLDDKSAWEDGRAGMSEIEKQSLCVLRRVRC
jgi:hypothetical protein